jgi:diguanylate cyclase (GGDEF)-like protein
VEVEDDGAARGFAGLCRATGQCTLLLDDQFDIVWHTPSLRDLLGWDTVAGRNGLEFIHPDDLSLVADLLARIAGQSTDGDNRPFFRPDPTDIRLLTSSGHYVSVDASMHDHSKEPDIRGFLVTCRLMNDRSDIGRSVELLGTGAPVEDVLALVARLVDKMFGGSAQSTIAWWHDDEVLTAWSPDPPAPHSTMVEAAGHAARLGIREVTTIHDLDDPILCGAGAVARQLGYTTAYIMPIVSPSGPEVMGSLLAWGYHSIEMVLYPARPVHIGLRLAALAIMDGRTKNDLRWAASHDPLTLLFNRAEFSRQLDVIGSSVALLYIDLDDFKPINDMHGHSVGDAVLVEVASRIRESAGATAVTGRLGGDEFAIAVPGLGDISVGLELAGAIIEAIRRPIRVSDITVGVGASVGVAFGLQPLIPSVLVQRADEALLEAKSSGKNTVKAAA